jgi:HlyD family secretion protein
MKKNRKWWILGGVVVVVCIALILILGGSSKSEVQFRFDAVSKGDIQVFVTATGTINPVVTVEVGTQVSGIVAKLYADYNSIVKNGQVIAQIDTTFLVQSVKDAEATLEKALAQQADSKRSFERVKTLYDRNLESQASYDAALTTLETANALVKSAQASLERARVNLAYATIYAPIDGVVIDRKVNVGQTVAASFSSPTLYTIANDLRKMQVQTTVDESDIGRVAIGQHAVFTVDAYPNENFEGIVSQIRLAPTTISNVVNYIVVIDFDNSELKLMPGMTANVKILVGEAHDVLRIPNLALRFQPSTDLIDTTELKNQKGFAARQVGGNEYGTPQRQSKKQATGPMAQAGPPTRRTFGITPRFPEYQKSGYDASSDKGFGRVWILNEKKKLTPIFVHTGLNDGKYTEISSPALHEGQQIVMGILSNNNGTKQVSPLAGGGSRPPGGGRR